MKKRIVCFGDSITWGADPVHGTRFDEDRWPMVLQQQLGDGYWIIEEGQGGRTIASDDPAEGEKNGLRYLLPCLETHTPFDLLIVMLGTNDCKRKFGYSAADIGWEMRRFLEKALAYNHFDCDDHFQVLLVAPPTISEAVLGGWLGDLFGGEASIEKSRGLADQYREVAKRCGCHFLNGADYARTSDADGIHLDAKDQRSLGLAIAERAKAILG